MPKRLFDDQDDLPLEPGASLIGGLEAPTTRAGTCGLAVCLRAALKAVGCEAGYPWLMGLTGAAYMFRHDDRFDAGAAVEDRWRFAAQALRALGRRGSLLEDCGEAARQALQAELEVGRPALALGWGSRPGDWSLIAGRRGEDLLGYPLDHRGRPEQAPAQCRLLMLLGPDSPPPEPRPVVLEALLRAHDLLGESALEMKRWAAHLVEASKPYGAGAMLWERFLSERWLVQCLIDARLAGHEFLLRAGEQLAEDEEEALLAAAEVMARVAVELEELVIPLEVAQRARPWEDPEWPQWRSEFIAAMVAQEEQVRRLLRQTLRPAGYEVSSGE